MRLGKAPHIMIRPWCASRDLRRSPNESASGFHGPRRSSQLAALAPGPRDAACGALNNVKRGRAAKPGVGPTPVRRECKCCHLALARSHPGSPGYAVECNGYPADTFHPVGRACSPPAVTVPLKPGPVACDRERRLRFGRKRDEWQSSLTHIVYWFGTDDTGTLRPDLNRVAVASFRTNVAQNAALVFGAAHAAGNASVSAPVFNPAAGPPLTKCRSMSSFV